MNVYGDRKVKKTCLENKLWVAVKVWRGFPAELKAFYTEKAALKQEKIWRKQMNLEYDETGIFKINKIGRRAKLCYSVFHLQE